MHCVNVSSEGQNGHMEGLMKNQLEAIFEINDTISIAAKKPLKKSFYKSVTAPRWWHECGEDDP